MNILLTLDSAFVAPAVVLLQSLRDNHPQTELTIYILHSRLSAQEQKLIRDFCKDRDMHLHLIQVDISPFSVLRTAAPFPAEVYFRMLAHQYTPENVDRILYLDADIVCNGSLLELYNMDFEGNYLVACASDPNFAEDRDTYLANWDARLAARGKYFNSGVLLINCVLLRQHQIGLADYLAVAEEYEGQYLFDQGLLNLMFSRQTQLLTSDRYNYRFGSYFFRSRGDASRIPQCDAAIIHFAGEVCPYKPWDLVFDDEEIDRYSTDLIHFPKAPDFIICRQINDLCRIWWQYAEKTPVYPRLLALMEAKKEWFKRGIYGYITRLTNAVNEPYFEQKRSKETQP